MSEVERVELRAERLRVLVAAIGEEPTMDASDTFASGIVPGGFRDYLEGLEYEHVARDLDLACELANLAREIRARQWHSLERLGALIASGKGETPDGEVRLAAESRSSPRPARCSTSDGDTGRPAKTATAPSPTRTSPCPAGGT